LLIVALVPAFAHGEEAGTTVAAVPDKARAPEEQASLALDRGTLVVAARRSLPFAVSGAAVASLGMVYIGLGALVGAAGLLGTLATPRWPNGAARALPGEPIDVAQVRILGGLGSMAVSPLIVLLGAGPLVLGIGLLSAGGVVAGMTVLYPSSEPAPIPSAAPAPAPVVAPPAPEVSVAILDADGDAIQDAADKCPQQSGPPENEGCPWPDSDGDQVLDRDDKCPAHPGPAGSAGCPVADSDGDDVPDHADKCPAERGPAERHGCPLGDADKDGLGDGIDRCPDQAGPADNGGCPRVGAPVAEALNQPVLDARCADPSKLSVIIRGDKVEIPAKVQFESGTAVMLRSSLPVLEQVVLTLACRPDIKKLRLAGHTDSSGTESINTRLSHDRAAAVRDYLVTRGNVAKERIETVGHGAAKPIASEADERGREVNRRVEFVIVEVAR